MPSSNTTCLLSYLTLVLIVILRKAEQITFSSIGLLPTIDNSVYRYACVLTYVDGDNSLNILPYNIPKYL